ncbi:MAG TPA: D-2-hydroxyacid dehydrogenase, partial [Stellaceae bacterium]|nr:D-2-hydroxyacid dehydrogenase [Stellaceae bacterium]
KIVFLERATLAPQITLKRPNFAHDYVEYERSGADQVLERLADADIAIINKVQVRAPVLEQLPKLKLIAVAATGTDCVDVAWCREHGVAVSNVRGYSVNTVPEHVFALMLALRRGIVGFRADVLAGEWQRANQFCFFNHPIRDLSGSRLGIVGGGAIGGKVARIAEGFGMEPVFAGRKGATRDVEVPVKPGYVAFDELIETADAFTIHCPLTPETRGLIGLPEFRRMKRSAIVVNTARGGIIAEEDLETALREGLIAGAGIDVTLPEPPAADATIMRIAALPNAIVTPHVAWASDEAQQILADQLIRNIENFVAGNPTNLLG